MSLWGGRFQDGSSAMFRTVNDSLPFDRVLASQDIRGSIAWARAIAKAGVLTQDEHQQLRLPQLQPDGHEVQRQGAES